MALPSASRIDLADMFVEERWVQRSGNQQMRKSLVSQRRDKEYVKTQQTRKREKETVS